MSLRPKNHTSLKNRYCVVGKIDGFEVSVIGGARYIMVDFDVATTIHCKSSFLTETEANNWIEEHYADPVETPQSIKRFFGHFDPAEPYKAINSVLLEKRISKIHSTRRLSK